MFKRVLLLAVPLTLSLAACAPNQPRLCPTSHAVAGATAAWQDRLQALETAGAVNRLQITSDPPSPWVVGRMVRIGVVPQDDGRLSLYEIGASGTVYRLIANRPVKAGVPVYVPPSDGARYELLVGEPAGMSFLVASLTPGWYEAGGIYLEKAPPKTRLSQSVEQFVATLEKGDQQFCEGERAVFRVAAIPVIRR